MFCEGQHFRSHFLNRFHGAKQIVIERTMRLSGIAKRESIFRYSSMSVPALIIKCFFLFRNGSFCLVSISA